MIAELIIMSVILYLPNFSIDEVKLLWNKIKSVKKIKLYERKKWMYAICLKLSQ